VPDEKGVNRYGLDMAYFRCLFNRELNIRLSDYRPDELARVLARAALTADSEVLSEPEFRTDERPTPTKSDESCTWELDHGDNSWEASCGYSLRFEGGDPKGNGVNFCPECGKPCVVIEPDAEEQDDE
jgi:hypothetical protein